MTSALWDHTLPVSGNKLHMFRKKSTDLYILFIMSTKQNYEENSEKDLRFKGSFSKYPVRFLFTLKATQESNWFLERYKLSERKPPLKTDFPTSTS